MMTTHKTFHFQVVFVLPLFWNYKFVNVFYNNNKKKNNNDNNDKNNTRDNIYSPVIYGAKPYTRVHSGPLSANCSAPGSQAEFTCRLL